MFKCKSFKPSQALRSCGDFKSAEFRSVEGIEGAEYFLCVFIRLFIETLFGLDKWQGIREEQG